MGIERLEQVRKTQILHAKSFSSLKLGQIVDDEDPEVLAQHARWAKYEFDWNDEELFFTMMREEDQEKIPAYEWQSEQRENTDKSAAIQQKAQKIKEEILKN